MQENIEAADSLTLAADIVAAYVSNNSVPSADLPALIRAVHGSLLKVATGVAESPAEAVVKEPAVPIKKSVTNDYIVCLEDGKKFKSLKRHLATSYDLTPAGYRMKWKLPSDYPMVAPAYAAARSALAKAAGLGSARAAAKMVAPPVKLVDSETAKSSKEPAAKKRSLPKKPAAQDNADTQ